MSYDKCLAQRLSNAIKTDVALYDREARFFNADRAHWPPYVRSVWDAYENMPEAQREIWRPTREDIDDYLPAMGLIARYRKSNPQTERNDWRLLQLRAWNYGWRRICERMPGRKKPDAWRKRYGRIIDEIGRML